MKIVKTKTSDGFQFDGLLSEAENSKKIIIHIHGMAGSILLEEFYTHMHNYYPSNGFSFLAGEHRGTGMVTDFVASIPDSIRGNAFEKFEDCVTDIQSWIDYAKSLGYQEIWLEGHSLGTAKVAYYINQVNDHEVSGLILLSPSDMLGLVHTVDGEKDHQVLFPEATKLVSQGEGQKLLSHRLWGYNILSASTYLNFFGEAAKDAIFNYGNESLGWKVVNSINIPVLAISGTKDDGITPVIDVHNAMKKLESELKKSPKVRTVIYQDAEHSFYGFGRNIVHDVIEFISSVTISRSDNK